MTTATTTAHVPTKHYAKELPTGVALHGEIVTWDLTSQTTCPYSQLVQALKDADLDPSAAKALSAKHAFGRACKTLRENRVIDRLKNAGGKLEFQFTRKHLTGGRFEHAYECVVKVDAETGVVTCWENPQLAEMAQQLLAEAISTRTASDISRLVQRLFEQHGDLFPINPHKGVAYFVPQMFTEFTDKIDLLFAGVGGTLWRWPVPKGTGSGDASVRDAVERGMTTLIADLVAVVDGWNEKTQDTTMLKYASRFHELRHKLQSYSSYLKNKQEHLEHVLAQAGEQMKQKLTDVLQRQSQG